MSWKMSRLSSSLLGLLRDPDGAANNVQKLEDIREEMLGYMAHFMVGKAVRPAVWAKVLYAKDIQSLWYLRSDLMHILSKLSDEAAATKALENITEMFGGHIPPAMFASARKRS
jgi:hypothetical protein